MLQYQIERIVNSLVDKELTVAPEGSPWAIGSIQQTQRMNLVAWISTSLYDGDLVEIGCMCGATTSELAKIAWQMKRRVIAVDPWEEGRPNYSPENYDKFIENTKQWTDIIDVVRLPSEDPDAIEFIKTRPLCFAYIDGAHDTYHCSLDLQTTNHAKVICMDDLWSQDIKAIFDGSPREKVFNSLCKEGYLI